MKNSQSAEKQGVLPGWGAFKTEGFVQVACDAAPFRSEAVEAGRERVSSGGADACLLVEIVAEGLKLAASPHAALPPGSQESCAVARELYKGGRHGEHGHAKSQFLAAAVA